MDEILKNLIREKGPIDIAEFMGLALGHPAHGYYMKGDPFGARGDFTTAPEISQMFGEMVAAWIMDVWQQMGSPVFTLMECGPGRGTLMADIMRATKNVPGFHDSAKVHLLEISPALRAMQAAALENYAPEWHVNLETLPDRPMIVIANEFLDALPVRQLIHTADGWKERVVGIANGNFAFDTKELPFNLPVDAAEGAIFEISPVRSQFVTDLVKKLNGAALIIDYGHSESGIGDTLQALKSHKYISPLEEIGNADLTTHVDFHAVKLAAEAAGAEVSGPVEQGAFLKDLGIAQRAEILTLRATPAQKFDIEKALQRLTDPSQMGSLFKVMGLTNGQNLSLPGF
ncbi:MAG: SAM-dependent methyltransferase [Alphaproteobacteria bacterium]|jgi:NADH dehydrogenase [ubiquinone] 1 alpha subcomplex assembly factor 7|nr:SAM-dependent methyltransferase [Alphaproteobacteria bacterium]